MGWQGVCVPLATPFRKRRGRADGLYSAGGFAGKGENFRAAARSFGRC
nr:hypothetical protein RVX_0936 [Nitratidesulfovibrio sp. HK-II]